MYSTIASGFMILNSGNPMFKSPAYTTKNRITNEEKFFSDPAMLALPLHLRICAERNAISTAIANGEKSKIKAVAIFSPNSALCSPCGACRQWIYELKSDNAQIILADENSEPVVYTIEELLPHGFML